MADEKQLAVSRVVKASPDRVFALLADPKQHHAIDGSGTVQGAEGDRITQAGQVFVMNMHRDDLGHYRSLNTVTEFVPGERIGWAPELDRSYESQVTQMLATITASGHTYAYSLREVPEGTEVTQTYDWSGVTDPNFEALCPFVSREELMATLDRLADAVEQPPGAATRTNA